MANFTVYKLLDACHERGCPVCRIEVQSVERYLDSQLYENVNSPKWRDQLRLSLGFCREHAALAVDKRLGDPLGFSIIYRDVINSVLNGWNEDRKPARSPRGWTSVLGRVPEQARAMVERMLFAITPRKSCPVCLHRDEIVRNTLQVLVEELKTPEMVSALQASEGLCLPHLRLALGHIREQSVCETLLTIQRGKLEALKAELDEFIRKNDHRFAGEGFGKEGDAWLRAIGIMVGKRE